MLIIRNLNLISVLAREMGNSGLSSHYDNKCGPTVPVHVSYNLCIPASPPV